MSHENKKQFDKLREKAEAQVANTYNISDDISQEEAIELLHELQVHRVELELQNEELRRSQENLVKARDKYTELYEVAPTAYLTINQRGMIETANVAATRMLSQPKNKLLQSHFVSYISSSYQDDYHLLRQNMMKTATTQFIELKLRRADGSHLFAYIEGKVGINPETDEQCIYLSITDITELRQTQVNEQRQRLLAEVLRDSALVLNSSLDFSTVVDRILELIYKVIPYYSGELLLILDGQARITNVRSFDSELLERSGDLVPIIGKLAEMRDQYQAIQIDDLESQNLHVDYPNIPSLMRSYLGVPIQLRDEVIGFISLFSTETTHFTEEHLDYLEQFTAHAAIAIQNATLYGKAHELAQLQERQRVAHELHDTVTQMLFSSSIIAEALKKTENNDKKASNLEYLHRLNRGALNEMNNLLVELKGIKSSPTNLSILLKRLAEGVRGRSNMEIDLEIDELAGVSLESQFQFYRVTRQVINTFINDGHVNTISITVQNQPDQVVLTIKDNNTNCQKPSLSSNGEFGDVKSYVNSLGLRIEVCELEKEGTQLKIIGGK